MLAKLPVSLHDGWYVPLLILLNAYHIQSSKQILLETACRCVWGGCVNQCGLVSCYQYKPLEGIAGIWRGCALEMCIREWKVSAFAGNNAVTLNLLLKNLFKVNTTNLKCCIFQSLYNLNHCSLMCILKAHTYSFKNSCYFICGF